MESLPTLVMLKSAVLEAILTRLDSELETLTRGARASFAAATDPDSKAENKYDTRTLEASYVARGQAQRVTEVQTARHHYAALQMTASDTIRLGSLVGIEVTGRSDHYFIGPSEGGLEISVDGTEILTRLEKGYGVKVAGGQDTLKGKIIRVAHMGYMDMFDVLTAVSAIEMVLVEMGHKLEPGAGIAAAQKSLTSGIKAKA